VAEKKAKEKNPALNMLPEGVTEILHPKVHGPFIGELEDSTTQTGLITNMFAAPMFRHDAEPTDFLMVLGKKPSSKHTGPAALGVVLRPLPANTFTVGQIEPRIKVCLPTIPQVKNTFLPSLPPTTLPKPSPRQKPKKIVASDLKKWNDSFHIP
jgi:hypothetical protein